MSHDGHHYDDPRPDLERQVRELRQLLRATALMLLAALGEGEEA